MADRVELAFRRSAARCLPEGAAVAVAVSGGGDSVALLQLMQRRTRGAGRLTVAHLDHGLRRGSRADREFVEGLARDLGLPCVAERIEVAGERRRDESPEEAARRVRRKFLLEAAERSGSTRIVTGHTLDDQAETILMRWARGAGAAALCGMTESGPGPFAKPLLELSRADLRQFLDRRELTYRVDPSNRDLRFDRNRVRRLIMPLLTEALNPKAARHVVKAARLLREDAELLDDQARRAAEEIIGTNRLGAVTLRRAELATTAPPLARRIVHLALLQAGADPRRLATRHVDAVLGLAAGPVGREHHLPGRLAARRSATKIEIFRRC